MKISDQKSGRARKREGGEEAEEGGATLIGSKTHKFHPGVRLLLTEKVKTGISCVGIGMTAQIYLLLRSPEQNFKLREFRTSIQANQKGNYALIIRSCLLAEKICKCQRIQYTGKIWERGMTQQLKNNSYGR